MGQCNDRGHQPALLRLLVRLAPHFWRNAPKSSTVATPTQAVMSQELDTSSTFSPSTGQATDKLLKRQSSRMILNEKKLFQRSALGEKRAANLMLQVLLD